MAIQPQSPDSSGFPGQANAFDLANEPLSQLFIIRQLIDRTATTMLVQVVAVTTPGGLGPVGRLDVRPLVNLVDGEGNAYAPGVIHDVPYFRLQGGANAVVIDPQVGDIGAAIFASRDISSVKATGAQANPGSRRRYNLADALFIGCFLTQTPTQYVSFTATGITLHSPTKVTIEAPTVAITGSTLTHNGKNIGSSHTHGDPQGGVTGVPT